MAKITNIRNQDVYQRDFGNTRLAHSTVNDNDAAHPSTTTNGINRDNAESLSQQNRNDCLTSHEHQPSTSPTNITNSDTTTTTQLHSENCASAEEATNSLIGLAALFAMPPAPETPLSALLTSVLATMDQLLGPASHLKHTTMTVTSASVAFYIFKRAFRFGYPWIHMCMAATVQRDLNRLVHDREAVLALVRRLDARRDEALRAMWRLIRENSRSWRHEPDHDQGQAVDPEDAGSVDHHVPGMWVD